MRHPAPPYRTGFTLVELVIVMVIMTILFAMIFPKIREIRQRAARNSCMQNTKIMAQAVIAHAMLNGGRLLDNRNTPKTPFTVVHSAAHIYGALFNPGTWDNLNSLVCPNNAQGIPPTSTGYQETLNMAFPNASIDYWIVFAGNVSGGELSILDAPSTNVIVIERFSGASGGQGQWTSDDFHDVGGNAAHINGSARFYTVFPRNSTLAGGSVLINDGNVAN